MKPSFILILTLLGSAAFATDTTYTLEEQNISFIMQIETGYAWETPVIKNIALKYKPNLVDSLMLSKAETVEKENIQGVRISEPQVETWSNNEQNSVRTISIQTNSENIKEITIYVNNDHPEESIVSASNGWRNVFQRKLKSKKAEIKEQKCRANLRFVN